MNPTPLDPALALTAACLGRPAKLDDIARRAAVVTDWQQVARWAARHRVSSLVCDALRQLPAGTLPSAVADGLYRTAHQLAAEGLRQVIETHRLTQLLGAAGIPTLTLKGPALAMLAFGDPLLRNSRDIDLLVAPARFDQADALLATEGYRRLKPAAVLSAHRGAAYRRWAHEYVYRSDARGVLLEVKDRLHPTRSVMPIDLRPAFERPYRVDVAGRAFPTLPPVDLFLYLCTHGSRHGWFRLKWIADIGALIARFSEEDLVSVEQRAATLGLSRPLHEALLLSRHWVSAPLPAPFRDAVAADRAAHRRAARAHRRLCTMGPDGNPLARRGFVAGLDINELGIRPEWSYRWAVVQRHGLARLYSLVRPRTPA